MVVLVRVLVVMVVVLVLVVVKVDVGVAYSDKWVKSESEVWDPLQLFSR